MTSEPWTVWEILPRSLQEPLGRFPSWASGSIEQQGSWRFPDFNLQHEFTHIHDQFNEGPKEEETNDVSSEHFSCSSLHSCTGHGGCHQGAWNEENAWVTLLRMFCCNWTYLYSRIMTSLLVKTTCLICQFPATPRKSEDDLGVATPDMILPNPVEEEMVISGHGFVGQYKPLTKGNLEEKLLNESVPFSEILFASSIAILSLCCLPVTVKPTRKPSLTKRLWSQKPWLNSKNSVRRTLGSVRFTSSASTGVRSQSSNGKEKLPMSLR